MSCSSSAAARDGCTGDGSEHTLTSPLSYAAMNVVPAVPTHAADNRFTGAPSLGGTSAAIARRSAGGPGVQQADRNATRRGAGVQAAPGRSTSSMVPPAYPANRRAPRVCVWRGHRATARRDRAPIRRRPSSACGCSTAQVTLVALASPCAPTQTRIRAVSSLLVRASAAELEVLDFSAWLQTALRWDCEARETPFRAQAACRSDRPCVPSAWHNASTACGVRAAGARAPGSLLARSHGLRCLLSRALR